MAIEATMFGQVDKKKSLWAVCLNLSDEDLLAAIDMMKFDVGEKDTRTKK